ncbi:MAG: hypothetical protein ACR2HZ_06495 [Gemmatimonadaceae bacterium]
MPFIRNLWLATLTSNLSDSGTDDELVVIVNQNGLDVVHRDLGFGDVATGGGKLYRHDISEDQVLPQNYYMRIGTRGDDAWRPRMIAAWCERFTNGNIVPLGYDESIDTILSTDSSEGRISLPVRQIGAGMIRTGINRVMLVTGTNVGDSATDSPIHVRVTAGQGVVVDHTIPDTSQDDLEGAEGNVYYLPVLSTFTRSQLTDTSIELSIEGDDAWLPIVVVMFGLDTASGQPNTIVPLVHATPWPFGVLSKAPDEGVESVALPLAPMDP